MIREELRKIIIKAMKATRELSTVADKIDFAIERPKHKNFGDFSTNIALTAAPLIKNNPLNIAEAINKNLADQRIEKTEVVRPGFINIFFKNDWYYDVLRRIEDKNEKFGEIDFGKGKKVLLEYVSANPVGPLHIGHGRWAAVGDTLAKTLRKANFQVTTEFYVNNYGRQINLFFQSVRAAYKNLFGENTALPKDGYKGAYINDIAIQLKKFFKNTPYNSNLKNRFEKKAFSLIINQIKEVLLKMDIIFDLFFYEKEMLHDKNQVKKVISKLRKSDKAYEKDEALWLNTSDYGDEKDRVLIRGNGETTYFAADIAYHKNKIERGFDRLINIWGADHHGYIARVEAAISILGENPKKLTVILGQLVNLLKSGKPIKMSKRTGNLITLEELIDEVGVDAIRFMFLTKSTDTTLDFDINLVKEQSDKNPVYYVQYAHARISSILRFAESKGIKYKGIKNANLNLLVEEKEITLIKTLEEFEETVENVAKNLTPHILTTYARKLATDFHSFYTVAKVITDNTELTQARLGLLNSAQITLKNVLKLLGVKAPKKM